MYLKGLFLKKFMPINLTYILTIHDNHCFNELASHWVQNNHYILVGLIKPLFCLYLRDLLVDFSEGHSRQHVKGLKITHFIGAFILVFYRSKCKVKAPPKPYSIMSWTFRWYCRLMSFVTLSYSTAKCFLSLTVHVEPLVPL